jgi:hypothetical protein
MQSKFDTIFESNFNRFSGGGFLTGDVIKFKEGWESDEWSKKAPAQVIEKIKELAGSDLVLRVSSVKALRPSVNSSVDQASGVDNFHLDVTQETAPGFYNGNFITVPQEIVEMIDTNGAPPEIPDSLRRQDNVNVKPEEITLQDTETSDFTPVGSPEAHNLPKDNTTLPGATAAVSYTSQYLS